jgi:hypothetical protein
MPARQLQIESVDRLTDDTFVLNFSDETVAILTDQELLEGYADRRITAHGFSHIFTSKST